MSLKNYGDSSWDRTSDLPICSTAPRSPIKSVVNANKLINTPVSEVLKINKLLNKCV